MNKFPQSAVRLSPDDYGSLLLLFCLSFSAIQHA